MVMTLSAVQTASEEDPYLFGHYVSRRTDLVVRQEMTRRRSVSLRREPFARDLIVGPIRLDVRANPLPVFLAPLRCQPVGENRDAEDIGETEGPIVDKLR